MTKTFFCAFFGVLVSFLPLSSDISPEDKLLSAVATHLGAEGLPIVYEKVSGGLTNSNYRLQVGDKIYFASVGDEGAELLGSSLAESFACLCLVAPWRIAPQPRFFDEERRILFTEFIHEASTPPDLKNEKTVEEICSHLRVLHTSGVSFTRTFDPVGTIADYISTAQAMGADLPLQLTEEVLPKIEACLCGKGPFLSLAPCHLDLHKGNVLMADGRLLLVDWEYAAMADPFFDLASLASMEWHSDDEMNGLLKNYLGGKEPSEDEKKHLYLMRIIADARWAAWCYLQTKLSSIDCDYSVCGDCNLQECLKRLQRLDK